MVPLRTLAATAGPVFIAAFATYLATMPRLITIEDAGLFNGVCATGGIAHPPGYPLFTLICTPLYWLPINPVLLGNGLSAFFGALAAALAVAVLLQIGTRRLPAIFGGLLLAVSASFWGQSIIVEVYAFNAALFMATLLACIRFMQAPSNRLAAVIALLTGLGLANHWPLTLLSLPGLALIVLTQHPWLLAQLRQPRFIALVIGAGLLGLLPYVSLMLKPAPAVSYSGAIETFGEFVSYVLRESYASQDNQAAANITDKLAFVRWVLVNATEQVSWLALGFALAGVLLAVPSRLKLVNAGLLAIFAAHTVGLALLLGFDFQYSATAVFTPYPLVAWCCLALWAALGVDWLQTRTMDIRRGIAASVIPAILALLLTFASNLPANNRSDDWLADAYSRTVLESLDLNAAMIVRGDTMTLTLLYQRYVEGVRPDVDLFHIHNIVFTNQLPGIYQADRAAAALAMAAERPVYSAGIESLPIEKDYGIFTRHDGSGVEQPQHGPAHEAFRRRLIDAYLGGEIIQPHQRVFAVNLLTGFSRQLYGLAAQGALGDAEAEDLARLQTTFPGVMIGLYNALTRPRLAHLGPALVAQAFELEADLPPEAVNSSRASFYYYFAEAFLRGLPGVDPDPALGRILLLKGFEVWPVKDNPVVCRLQKLGPPPGHAVTQASYQAACAPRDASVPAPE